MAVQHVTQVPYRRVQGLEATTQAQIERNFDSVVAQLVPTGVVLPWGGKSALAVPQGWLLCDGSAVNRQAFASLYAVIGTEFGAGDGSTTFNVPNMSDRFPRGTHLGSEVGDTGGSANAVLVSHGHTITVNANNFNTGGHSADHAHHTTTGGVSANHSHAIGNDGHNHVNNNGVVFMNCSAVHGHGGGCGQLAESPSYGGCTGFGCNMTTSTHNHSHGGGTAGISVDHTHSGWSGGVNTNHVHNANHGHTASSSTDGVSATNANLPPYMDFRFIIKT